MRVSKVKAVEGLLVASSRLRVYAMDNPEEAEEVYKKFLDSIAHTGFPSTIETFATILEILATEIGKGGEKK